MTQETSTPTVDELEAKSARLAAEVDGAKNALDVAKTTFADAARSDPTAVSSLLELASAVQAAEATVTKALSAVKSNQAGIDGIAYDTAMAGVMEATTDVQEVIRGVGVKWFGKYEGLVAEFHIDSLTITAKREESGALTVSVKPTGDAMPKRPTSKRATGGNGGAHGKRSVTANGVEMSCRAYVEACGDQASPAAQADIAKTWTGSPVSYTNEAKRLAAKNNDTFA